MTFESINDVLLLALYGLILVLITYFVIRNFSYRYLFFGLGLLVLLWRGYIFGLFFQHLINEGTADFLNGPVTRYPAYLLAIGMICYSIYLMHQYRKTTEDISIEDDDD